MEIQAFEKFKVDVQTFLTGNLEKALILLEDHVLHENDTHRQLILLRRGYNKIEDEFISGVIDVRGRDLGQTKIVKRILDLLNKTICQDFSLNKLEKVTWSGLRTFYDESFLQKEQNRELPLNPIYVAPPYSIYWEKSPLKRHGGDLSREVADGFIGVEKIDNFDLELGEHILQWVHDTEYRRQNDIHFSSGQLMLLFGRPGSGKTTFCENLLKAVYNQSDFDQTTLVFYVRLRDIQRNRREKDKFVDIITSYLSDALRCKIGFSMGQNSFFILDGLDELIAQEGYTEEAAKEIVNSLQKKLKASPNTCVLLTCRTAYMDLSFGVEWSHFMAFRLDPFSQKEQELWIDKYIALGNTTSLSIDSFKRLKTNSQLDVKELFDQPLLLTLIMQDPEAIAGGAIGQGQVYHKLIKSVIERELQVRSTTSLSRLRVDDLITALQLMAFNMSRNKFFSLSSAELNELLAGKFPFFQGEVKKGDHTVMNFFVGNFYLQKGSTINGPDEKRIEFIHNSFREFLTAQYLFKESQVYFSSQESKPSLNWLTETYGGIYPTEAITDFLVEAIDLEDGNRTVLLSEKMEEELDEFILHDFTALESSNKEYPLRRSLQALYFFWLIYGHSKKQHLRTGKKGERNNRFKQLISFVIKRHGYRLIFNGGNLKELDLSGCRLVSMSFEDAKLINANFEAAIIENTAFDGADLRKIRMDGSRLEKVSFGDFRFVSASKDEYEEEYEDDYEEKVINTRLSSGSFQFVTFSDVNFEGADLTNCNFYQADLRTVRLSFDQISTSNLSSAKVDSPNWMYEDVPYSHDDHDSEYLLGIRVEKQPKFDQDRKVYHLVISKEEESSQ